MDEVVISVDPGREKCGVAVVHREQGAFYKSVIETCQLTDTLRQLASKYNSPVVILGNRTTSREAKRNIEALSLNGAALTIILVDEHRSTDAARQRYWQENPPRGLKKLIPLGMLVPPVPVDDWVAVILAERYFKHTPPFGHPSC